MFGVQRGMDITSVDTTADAVFEPQRGVVVRGIDAIRCALAELLALEPQMTTTAVDGLTA
jgi:hypothetical protein